QKSVGPLLGVDTERAQTGNERRDPVTLLHPQFRGAGDVEPTTERGAGREHWQLVDERGDLRGRDDQGAMVAVRDLDEAHWLTGRLFRLLAVNPGAQPLQRRQIPQTVRVEPTALQAHRGAWQGGGRRRPDRARGGVAGHGEHCARGRGGLAPADAYTLADDGN